MKAVVATVVCLFFLTGCAGQQNFSQSSSQKNAYAPTQLGGRHMNQLTMVGQGNLSQMDRQDSEVMFVKAANGRGEVINGQHRKIGVYRYHRTNAKHAYYTVSREGEPSYRVDLTFNSPRLGHYYKRLENNSSCQGAFSLT